MEFKRHQFTYREALAEAMDICSWSEKCCYDMELKCREWQLPEEETVQLIACLVTEKFLDQLRYAKSFVNDKFKFNKWGKIKLAYALRQKKIEEQFIREALSCLPEHDYMQVLADLLSAKARAVKGKDSYTRRSKLVAFAQSRGFEVDEALRIIEKM